MQSKPEIKKTKNYHNFRNPRKAFEPKKNISAHERKRKYEEQRHERKFNCDWQAKRPWLKFDDIKNSMTCAVCIKHYGTDANVFQNLKTAANIITAKSRT